MRFILANKGLLLRAGNLPAPLLNAAFLSLKPFQLMQRRYIRLLEPQVQERELEDFVRLENWVLDGPDQAAAALAQFVKWF